MGVDAHRSGALSESSAMSRLLPRPWQGHCDRMAHDYAAHTAAGSGGASSKRRQASVAATTSQTPSGSNDVWQHDRFEGEMPVTAAAPAVPSSTSSTAADARPLRKRSRVATVAALGAEDGACAATPSGDDSAGSARWRASSTVTSAPTSGLQEHVAAASKSRARRTCCRRRNAVRQGRAS